MLLKGLFVLAVLGFELRASHFNAGAVPLEPCLHPFLLWLFYRWDFAFLSGQPGPPSSYFKLTAIAGCMLLHLAFSLEMGRENFFAQAGLEQQ
jgi:hypothetical protein